MSLFSLLHLRRRFGRTGEPDTSVTLAVKTADIGVAGVQVVTPTAITLNVNTSSIGIVGVANTVRRRLNVSTSVIDLAGDKVIAGVRLTAKTGSFDTTGVSVHPRIEIDCKTSDIGLSGVQAYASNALLQTVKSADVGVIGQQITASRTLVTLTSQVDIAGIVLPTVLTTIPADITLGGVRASAFTGLITKSGDIGVTGVRSTARRTAPIKISETDLSGITVRRGLRLIAGVSEVGIAGVKTTHTRVLHPNSSDVGVTGVAVFPYAVEAAGAQGGDLRIRLSGGAANALQTASLGGIISTATDNTIQSQTTTAINGIPSTVIHDSYNNPYGAGTLRFYEAAPSYYTWQPFGGVESRHVLVTTADYYTVGSVNTGQVLVYYDGNTPSGIETSEVTISALRNETFNSIGFQESAGTGEKYRCFYLQNLSGSDILDIKVWMELPPTGGDTILMGLDPAGAGDGSTTGVAVTIVDEDTAPAGVTFSDATAEAPLTIASMTVNQVHAIWVKRIATTTNVNSFDTSTIAISAFT